VKLEVTGEMVLGSDRERRERRREFGGRFPQVSGHDGSSGPDKAQGRARHQRDDRDKPLDKAATYTLATNDYMFGGGDGYTVLKSAKPLLGVRDAKLMANDVMAYITARKTVAPKVEGRIKLKM
jgi:5'-nucleotidase / UDP-sugar diphosphatase